MTATNRSLSILFISHDPISPTLGTGRATLGLVAHLRRLGHAVDTFDLRDAFPHHLPRLGRFRSGLFAREAAEHVRLVGSRYEVIDAQQGDLPYTKQALHFEGLLVARSHGLFAFYENYAKYARATWPGLAQGTRVGRAAAWRRAQREFAACRQSLEMSDVVFVLNEDERTYVADCLGLGDRCHVLPNGLYEREAVVLARAGGSVAVRSQAKEVAVVGSWSLRKGAADWAEIIKRTRAQVPDARFRFLGTGCQHAEVLAALGVANQDGVSIVPQYEPDELPVLLAKVTVGAFPSYAEGMGIGVLEQLAAGVPVVAYDVSGPRQLLGALGVKLTVPRGDVRQFSERLAMVLRLDESAYHELSASGRVVAGRYRWDEIARETASLYAAALANIRRGDRVAA